MLARRQLPPPHIDWNRRHGAPFGRRTWLPARVVRRLPPSLRARVLGPFCHQSNSATRTAEYPWAFFAAGLRRGQCVLEVGGGLSGFQFVLDASGCSVVNVDPGLDAAGRGWPCDPASMAHLNRLHGSRIELRNTTVGGAALEPERYDAAFSISVLEHLLPAEQTAVMQAVHLALKPGGLFVVTIDLFLNLAPFTAREANEYGRNVDVRGLVAAAPFVLQAGDPAELCGFAAFDARALLARLEEFWVGDYPAMAQCLVLQKAAPAEAH